MAILAILAIPSLPLGETSTNYTVLHPFGQNSLFYTVLHPFYTLLHPLHPFCPKSTFLPQKHFLKEMLSRSTGW